MNRRKNIHLEVGVTSSLPDRFKEDKVVVLGNCAIRSKDKIEEACKSKAIKAQYIGGCPPLGHRKSGYLGAHKIEGLPIQKNK